MNPALIIGKSIALVIWNTEIENDVRVLPGQFELENEQYFFVNKENGWKLSLDEEQLNRIKPVTEDTKDLLPGADFALPLSMGDLPDGDRGPFIKTGIHWNRHDVD